MADVTVDPAEKRLPDHPERSAPLPPWVGVAFGVALTGFAALSEAALLAVVLLGPATGLGPIMLVVPPVVMILGIALGVQGWRAIRRNADWRARAALRPGEPWHADWTWDSAGIAAETESGGSGFLVVVLMLGGLCVFFTAAYLGFLRDPVGFGIKGNRAVVTIFMGLMVGFWDLMFLRMTVAAIQQRRQRRRRPPAYLHFDTFPYTPGWPFRGQVRADGLAGGDGIVVTLRFLEERLVRSGAVRKSASVAVFQPYEARQVLQGQDTLSLELPLPAGDFTTRLSEWPKRYWELGIDAGTAGSKRFLVPVYARQEA